jgi:microcystin degradation protein MlrC
MRILVGGMNHESNTFNPIVTGGEDFSVLYGPDLLVQSASARHSCAGIVKTLEEVDCSLVPALLARAVPNGVVSSSFYQRIKSEFLDLLAEALAQGPIDGVCLALHGSMKVENLGCAEGDLVSAVREYLPHVPLTAALDMHATITPDLLAGVDGFVGYKTAPHVDCYETGAHAARLLLESLRTGKPLYTAYRRIPMLIAGEKSESEHEPMRSLIAACRAAEQEPAIRAASFLLGFPWADDEHNAASAVVTSLDAPEPAEQCAEQLVEAFWARRADFTFRVEHYDVARSLETAYQAVLEQGQAPVFVSDSGDNPTAGATGDATEVLEQILLTMETVDRLPTPLLYSGFYDAAAVAACIKAGEGAGLDISLGGRWDTLNGKKIPLRVEVRKLVRGYGAYCSDLALLACRNLLITATSKHIGFGDEGLLHALGVKPEDHCLVVVKLGYLEPCFRAIAARAIMATSKGCSNELLETLPYRNVRRPLYPLDK